MKIRALLPPAIIELTDLERYSVCHIYMAFLSRLELEDYSYKIQRLLITMGTSC